MPDSRPPAALFAVALIGAGPAAAHTPYLAPLNFAPSREVVTVLGGMFEETPLVSDFALRGSGYLETGPDGRTAPVAASVELKGVSASTRRWRGPAPTG